MFTGNQMPSPGRPPARGRGVKRLVAVFPLLLRSETEVLEGGFIRHPRRRPIVKGYSDSAGCVQFSLPPGRYTVLVREKGMWYANSYGGNGEIFEVEVKSGECASYEFRITHSASF